MSSSSIGDLFWRIGVDDAAFQTEVVKSATKAGDKAGATLGQRISMGFKNAGKGVLAGFGIGAGIGAFNLASTAVRDLTGFLGDSVKAAEAEQVSIAQLGAALKANIANWNGNSDAIEKVIQSRLRLGFNDDEQRASLAALVAMTKSETQALDISRTAMDLARLKGLDLTAASTLLGRAFEGNAQGLKRIGINVAAGVKGYELLGVVQQRLGGQAEAFSKTQAGAQAALSAEFLQLREDIGKRLLPVLGTLTNFAATTLVPTLGNVVNDLGAIGPVILPLAKVGVPLLTVALGVKLVNALKAVRLATLGTLGPLGWLALAAGVFAEVAPHVDDFIHSLGKSTAQLKDYNKLLDETGGNRVFSTRLEQLGIDAATFAKVVEAAGGDVNKAFAAIVTSSGNAAAAMNALWLEQDPVAMVAGWGRRGPQVRALIQGTLGVIPDEVQKAVDKAGATLEVSGNQWALKLQDGYTIFFDASTNLASAVPKALATAQDKAKAIAFATPGEVAKSLIEGGSAVNVAAALVAQAVNQPLETQAGVDASRKQIADLLGASSAGHAKALRHYQEASLALDAAAAAEAKKPSAANKASLMRAQDHYAAMLAALKASGGKMTAEQKAQLNTAELQLAGYLLTQDPKSKEAAGILAVYLKDATPATQAAMAELLRQVGIELDSFTTDAAKIAADSGTLYSDDLVAATKAEMTALGPSWHDAIVQKMTIDLSAAGTASGDSWGSAAYSAAAGWLTGLKQLLVGLPVLPVQPGGGHPLPPPDRPGPPGTPLPGFRPPPTFATGTPYVPSTGLALLHQGERVIPANQNYGGVTNYNLTVTGRLPVDDAADALSTLRRLSAMSRS